MVQTISVELVIPFVAESVLGILVILSDTQLHYNCIIGGGGYETRSLVGA